MSSLCDSTPASSLTCASSTNQFEHTKFYHESYPMLLVFLSESQNVELVMDCMDSSCTQLGLQLLSKCCNLKSLAWLASWVVMLLTCYPVGIHAWLLLVHAQLFWPVPLEIQLLYCDGFLYGAPDRTDPFHCSITLANTLFLADNLPSTWFRIHHYTYLMGWSWTSTLVKVQGINLLSPLMPWCKETYRETTMKKKEVSQNSSSALQFAMAPLDFNYAYMKITSCF